MVNNFKKKFNFSFADVVIKFVKSFSSFFFQIFEILNTLFFSIFYSNGKSINIFSIFERAFSYFFEFFYGVVYSFYSFFKFICDDFFSFIFKSPFFNFVISFIIFLFYFGYFTNDAELILFFSCLLVIFIATFSIGKTVDSIMEDYSIDIINIMSEKYFVQEEIFSFEKEIFFRTQILDDFTLYSTIFVEQQISEYVSLQSNLFSYYYSKIIESNLILDGEELFTQDHLASLLSFIELEKFVISYLVLDLILEVDIDLS